MTPPTVRFWRKVSGGDVSECWTWMGAKGRLGYGRFFLGNGQFTGAHRFAYEDVRGPIPDGLCIDHLCMNPSCVNPWHLEPVSVKENTRRWSKTVTHCPAGHPYDAANTHVSTRGGRSCRACDAERSRTRRAQRRYSDATPKTPGSNQLSGLIPA